MPVDAPLPRVALGVAMRRLSVKRSGEFDLHEAPIPANRVWVGVPWGDPRPVSHALLLRRPDKLVELQLEPHGEPVVKDPSDQVAGIYSAKDR